MTDGSGQQRAQRQPAAPQQIPQQRPPPRQPAPPRQQPPAAQPTPQESAASIARTGNWRVAIFVFMGTLLGSLIGFVAQANDVLDVIERVPRLLSPPPTIQVVGSGTILGEGLGMAADWEVGFESWVNADIVMEPIGSVSGVERAINGGCPGGCVHVLTMSEPMDEVNVVYNGVEMPVEQALAAANLTIECAAEIGYDLVAFITNVNTFPEDRHDVIILQDRDLRRILNGDIRNWSEVGGHDLPVAILARSGSGTTDYVIREFARYLPTEQMPFPPAAATMYHPDACETNSECLDSTLGTPGSLYWLSAAWMRTVPVEYLRTMAILSGDERPVDPLDDSANIEEYYPRLVRPLFMYVLRAPDTPENVIERAREYLSYVRSIEGQQILENYHFFNHFDRPEQINDFYLPAGFTAEADGTPRTICR